MKYVVSREKFVVALLLAAFWSMGTYAFLFQLWSEDVASAVRVPLSLVSDAIVMGIGICVLKRKVDYWLVGTFITYSFVSTIILNSGSLVQWLNGLRYYSMFLFMIPILRWLMSGPLRSRYFITLMDKNLYAFLIAQAPCLVYQYFAYGGWDLGGGTLGFFFSGDVSTIIYLISFYLMVKRWDCTKGYFGNLKDNYTLLLLLLPTFLNETKISFIYLFLYFLLLFPFSKRNLKKFVIALPVMVACLFAIGHIYLSLNTNIYSKDNVFSMEYLEWYIAGDEDGLNVLEYAFENMEEVEDSDYQRGLKMLAYTWIVGRHPDALMCGFGIGQMKGGTVVDNTPFAKDYRWLIDGTMMTLLAMLLELGVIGAIWLIWFTIVAFRFFCPHKIHRRKNLTLFLFAVMMLLMVYNVALNALVFGMIFFYLVYLCSRWDLVEDSKLSASMN